MADSQFPLPLNPAALQSALTQMPAPAGGPVPPNPANQPPATQPPEEQQDLNLGTIPTQGGQAQQPLEGGAVPKPSAMPALVGLFHQVFGDQAARGYFPPTGGGPGNLGAEPARPVSRLDAFENFLGNFLMSFSQGMAQGGQGPAANARGFGAAVQAPFQRELQQYQLGQQQQQVQAQTALQQAEAAKSQAQATMTPVQPYGPTGPTIYLPPAEAAKITQAQIGAQARVQAAGTQKQFISTPYGVFDTKAQDYVGGKSGAPMGQTKVTQDMVDNGVPPAMLNTVQKNTDIEGYMNARSRQLGIAQGSEGPALVNKGLAAATGGRQGVTSLGIGSPANNPLARLKTMVQTDQDRQKVEANQNQINLNLQRLQRIRANSDIINSAIDAGRISLAMGDDGLLHALAGRNVNLTAREAQFAADIQNMSEDINQLRIPLGAAGFRGQEGWAALQSQQGRLAQNPAVFRDVLDNTIDSFRAIQHANQDALDDYNFVLQQVKPKSRGGGNTPAQTGPQIHFTPSKPSKPS